MMGFVYKGCAMEKKERIIDSSLIIWIILFVGAILGLRAWRASVNKPTIALAPVASTPAPVASTPAPVVEKVKVTQYIIPAKTPGSFWFSEIDGISEAYMEGNDAEALRLTAKGLRSGSIVIFPKTPATFVDEMGGFVKLQPKVSTHPFWFNKKYVRAKK
jgi:hypothetical protein